MALFLTVGLFFVFSGCVSLPTNKDSENEPVNLIVNGDFSEPLLFDNLTASTTTLSKWFTVVSDWARASMDATINSNEVFQTTVNSWGITSWDYQPYWWMLQLAQFVNGATNTMYTLSFDASADTNTEMHVVVTLHAPNDPDNPGDDWWPTANLDQIIALTPDSTSFSFDVDLSGWDPWNPEEVYVKVGFEFGLSATDATIYIDNVKFIEK